MRDTDGILVEARFPEPRWRPPETATPPFQHSRGRAVGENEIVN